ncbi:hypothetical protein Barb7_00727 [Bacteroidales bacterium Barb7]|nr:hypothetical protein Barb7_00727 [Bacteroidales bacterium Barb7]
MRRFSRFKEFWAVCTVSFSRLLVVSISARASFRCFSKRLTSDDFCAETVRTEHSINKAIRQYLITYLLNDFNISDNVIRRYLAGTAASV